MPHGLWLVRAWLFSNTNCQCQFLLPFELLYSRFQLCIVPGKSLLGISGLANVVRHGEVQAVLAKILCNPVRVRLKSLELTCVPGTRRRALDGVERIKSSETQVKSVRLQLHAPPCSQRRVVCMGNRQCKALFLELVCFSLWQSCSETLKRENDVLTTQDVSTKRSLDPSWIWRVVHDSYLLTQNDYLKMYSEIIIIAVTNFTRHFLKITLRSATSLGLFSAFMLQTVLQALVGLSSVFPALQPENITHSHRQFRTPPLLENCLPLSSNWLHAIFLFSGINLLKITIAISFFDP